VFPSEYLDRVLLYKKHKFECWLIDPIAGELNMGIYTEKDDGFKGHAFWICENEKVELEFQPGVSIDLTGFFSDYDNDFAVEWKRKMTDYPYVTQEMPRVTRTDDE
jgi:hypothetical protein